MGGLVYVTNDEHGRYEKFLMQRDDYERQAHSRLVCYIHEFGEEENKLFAKQIKCITLKKSIEFCQACVNRGEAVDQDAMKKSVDKEIKDYKKHLRQMIKDSKACRQLKTSTRETVIEVRKIYHNIAKMIHPDINPKTKDIPALRELWDRCVAAYHTNALDEIKEIEVLASKALKDNGLEGQKIEIPDIESRIEKVKVQITKIITTKPYTYDKILKDKSLINAKHEELNNSMADYDDYEKNLNEIMTDMLADGMIIKIKGRADNGR